MLRFCHTALAAGLLLLLLSCGGAVQATPAAPGAAPAKTLGLLRRMLGKNAAGLVEGELAKDLTHVEPKDLASHLKRVFAL